MQRSTNHWMPSGYICNTTLTPKAQEEKGYKSQKTKKSADFLMYLKT